MHRAIQSAKKSEVRAQRWNVRIKSVVHFYGDDVVTARLEVRRHIKNKCREPAFMPAHGLAIHPRLGHGKRAVKFQEKFAPFILGIRREMQSVPARPAMIIISP